MLDLVGAMLDSRSQSLLLKSFILSLFLLFFTYYYYYYYYYFVTPTQSGILICIYISFILSFWYGFDPPLMQVPIVPLVASNFQLFCARC